MCWLITAVFLGLASLSAWLLNPLDQTAWRVSLNVPWLGSVKLRAEPILQLATSLPVRTLLHRVHWQSRYGVLYLQNTDDGFAIDCLECRFHLPELSKYPIQFDKLSLEVPDNNQPLSGWLELYSGQALARISYQGKLTSQGINLVWSLPKTPLKYLLKPLQSQSAIFRQVKVTGTLAATGTLKWPSRHWSVKPDLQGFAVSGLDTEQLNSAELKYHCPTTPALQNPPAYAWVNEKDMGRWLAKAVLLAEDANFTQHPGYDMSTLRYLLAQENHTKLPGGSTISQQLAKYFFTGGERYWLRKIEELLYAVEMENTLGKRRIFALYLNTVDWGPGICGAAQAASVYFGRKPSELSAAQAAWLAGIIRNPHRAWRKEYLPQMPDVERLSWVLGFMPKKVQRLPLALKFTEYLGNQTSLALLK